VPESENPFGKSESQKGFKQFAQRETRLLNLANKERRDKLQLAGTLTLLKREKSPQTKIRERKGFVTAMTVPDVFADKVKIAEDTLNRIDRKTGVKIPHVNEYDPPKDHKFRDEAEIEIGMNDFMLPPRIHAPAMENPHGLSVFAQRPKFITDKEKAKAEQQEAEEKFLAAGKPHDWIKYHKLPEKLLPVSGSFKDRHNKVTGGKVETT